MPVGKNESSLQIAYCRRYFEIYIPRGLMPVGFGLGAGSPLGW